MTRIKPSGFLLIMFFLGWHSPAQDKPSTELILKMDQAVSGPYGGQKSSTCVRVYGDGKVVYAHWWNSWATLVDKETGQRTRPEWTVSKEYQLEDYELWELSDFLQSKAVKKLASNFGPPDRPIDYFEVTTVQVMGASRKHKQISTREFYVANLVEKTRYPTALIVLMDQIREIESKASDKGNATPVPQDCQLQRQLPFRPAAGTEVEIKE